MTTKDFKTQMPELSQGQLRQLYRLIEEQVIFSAVESCEPDCSTVRHAYHQGQWDMHLRQEKALAELMGVDNG